MQAACHRARTSVPPGATHHSHVVRFDVECREAEGVFTVKTVEVVVDEGPVERSVQPNEHWHTLLSTSSFDPSTELGHCLTRLCSVQLKLLERKPGHGQRFGVRVPIQRLQVAVEARLGSINQARADGEHAEFAGDWAGRLNVDGYKNF